MKINDAWLITLVIQIGIALINISAENWSGMMGGIFGAWMCFIYWEKLKETQISRRPLLRRGLTETEE